MMAATPSAAITLLLIREQLPQVEANYCFVDAVTKEDEENFARFIDQVQEEDIILCESVQRELNSGFFERGKLMLHSENGLRHFQRLVHRFLAE